MTQNIEQNAPTTTPTPAAAKPSLLRQMARGFVHPIATFAYGGMVATIAWQHQVHQLNVAVAQLLTRLGG